MSCQVTANESEGPFCKPVQRPSWADMQALLLALAAGAAGLAGLCWWKGLIPSFAGIQTDGLLVVLITLNLAPPLVELAYKRFDPFDAKHLFLAYFFLILSFHSFCVIVFGTVVNPLFATPLADASTRIHALAAMVLGLAAFVIGCYLPLGNVIARMLPRLVATSSAGRIKALAAGCMAVGGLTFYLLMASAGGVTAFLANLGNWRTLGVLNGVGYLTFPVTGVLPAAVLLLLLHTLPARGQRLTWQALGALALAAVSLVPILILGFRVSLVPVILAYFAAWHYGRQRIRIKWLATLAVGLSVFLTLFSLIRSGQWTAGDAKAALLFRVPGLDIVERIVWRMSRGEPHRGAASMLAESATIIIPRTIWPAKPVPSGLAFADIFFYDFFIARGDPVDGVKSGISPTFIGEMLWVDGILAVVLGALALGVAARTAVAWRKRGQRLHVFIYATFMPGFAIFAEAPQIALNGVVMLSVMTAGMALILIVRLRPAKAGTAA